jgi:hypothetical protein
VLVLSLQSWRWCLRSSSIVVSSKGNKNLWSASSQTTWALASGSGAGSLLVSPNVKYRCYAQAGGVEESKFYLFWVVFPVRCISSISPRFYFRRHAFCFLPLAAILEFWVWDFDSNSVGKVDWALSTCWLWGLNIYKKSTQCKVWQLIILISISFSQLYTSQ